MKKTKVLHRLAALFMMAIITVLTTGCTEKIALLDPKGPI